MQTFLQRSVLLLAGIYAYLPLTPVAATPEAQEVPGPTPATPAGPAVPTLPEGDAQQLGFTNNKSLSLARGGGIGQPIPGADVEPWEGPPSQRDSYGEEFPRGKAEGGQRESEEEERRSPFEEPIETDRDAFTPATKTVPVNRLVVESSYSFIDNRGAPETTRFPELLFRYGLVKRLELCLGWNYEAGSGGNVVSGSSGEAAEGVDTAFLTRESRLLYGIKSALTEQHSWLPESVLIVMGLTPTGGEATATQLRAAYVFGWQLPNRWRRDSAVLFTTDSDNGNRFETWSPATVLRVPLGQRFQVHAEYFGQISQDRPSSFSHHFFSPGIRQTCRATNSERELLRSERRRC